MINSDAKQVFIEDGEVKKISFGDTVLWESSKLRFTILGDSLSEGLSKLTGKDICFNNKNRWISCNSFTSSGDTVSDILTKINTTDASGEASVVHKFVETADVVTICAGSDNFLNMNSDTLITYLCDEDDSISEDAYSNLNNHVYNLLSAWEENPKQDGTPYYLLNTIREINPNAKCVVVSSCNPYKYLNLNLDGAVAEELFSGLSESLLLANLTSTTKEVSQLVCEDVINADSDGLLDSLKRVSQKINRLGGNSYFSNTNSCVEKWICDLNTAWKSAVETIKEDYPEFKVEFVESKVYLNSIEDAPSERVDGKVYYSDLTNSKLTKNFDINSLPFESICGNDSNDEYWNTLLSRVIFEPGFNFDDLSFNNWDTFNKLLTEEIVSKVILPFMGVTMTDTGNQMLSDAVFEELNGKENEFVIYGQVSSDEELIALLNETFPNAEEDTSVMYFGPIEVNEDGTLNNEFFIKNCRYTGSDYDWVLSSTAIPEIDTALTEEIGQDIIDRCANAKVTYPVANDLTINNSDWEKVYNYVYGNNTDVLNIDVADVDADGTVDIVDLIYLNRYINSIKTEIESE